MKTKRSEVSEQTNTRDSGSYVETKTTQGVSGQTNTRDSGSYVETKTTQGVSEQTNTRDSGSYVETKTTQGVSEQTNTRDSGSYVETKTKHSEVSEKANAGGSERYARTKILPFWSTAQGSFKRQIILTFVVGFFFLTAAFTVYQVRTESAYLYRDSMDETISLAESLGASSRSWVLANDVVGLQEVVHSFQGHPGLRYAMVISPSGRVLAHSDATKVGQFVSDEPSLALIKAPPHRRIMIDNELLIDIAVPITIDNRHVGWARVGQGREEIIGNLHNMMLGSALFVLMAVVLSQLAALLIANRLGYRIGYLVRVAEAVQAGDYATRANISGVDEIAKLGSSLNHMLDVLARDEEQLRAASLYTRSLIEASLDPLVTISTEGKITDVNQATEKATGRSRSELIGTDFSDYFTEPEKAREGYQLVFANGFVTDYPLSLRHRDGLITDVLYNASVYRDESGEVMGVFAAARDITERKQAEFVLRQSEEGLKEAQRIAHLGSWYLDIATNQVYWSEELYKMYGFDPALPPPLYTESMKLFTPESWERLSAAIAKATETGIPYELELETVQKDGGRGWMLARGELVRNERGVAVRVRGVAMDITERKLAEEQLRRSEQGLAEAQRIAHLGNWELDLANNVLTWSDEIYRIFEIDKDKFGASYDAFLNAIHPDDRELVNNAYTESVKTKTPYDIVHRLLMKDGRVKYVNEKCETHYGEGGKPLRSVGTVHDITERKKIEIELRELNNDFVTLLENSGDFIYFKGKDSRIRFCSQTLANITGHHSWRDMIGKHDLEIFPEDTARIYFEEELPIFQQGKPLLNKTDPYYDEQGRPGWVNTNKWPVFGEDKKTVVGIFGISRDITELKRAENILQARLRLLEISSSRSMDELLTATLDEIEALTGSAIGFYHLVEPDQKTLSLQSWSTNTLNNMCAAEGQGSHYDIDKAGVWVDCVNERRPVIHNDYASLPHRKGMPEGHAPVVREVVVPILRGDQIKAIIGVGNKSTNYDEADVQILSQLGDLSWDIAERKRAEDEVKVLNRELENRVRARTAELESANKELESFSYSVSHDLRTPLRAIDGFSHILLDDYTDKLDDEGKRLLNVVRDSTNQMGQLIDDILKFSRTSRSEMTFSEIDMDGLAHSVVEELQPYVAGHNLLVEIEPIPPVMGDRAMMHQVFANLLSNAIKFSRTKEPAMIKVGGSIEGNEAIYYVKDNGAGFDMQYADKLFGVFQRLHAVSEFEGTGIGLAIVKRIVTRHGGRAWAEGKVNEGATIYFSIPALPLDQEAHHEPIKRQ